eukprot:gene15906-22039_t
MEALDRKQYKHKGGPVAQGMRPLTESGYRHKGGPVAQGNEALDRKRYKHKAGQWPRAGPVAQGMRALDQKQYSTRVGPVASGMRPLTEAVQHKGGPVAQGMRPLTEAVQHNGGPGAQGMRPLTEAVQHKGGPGAQGMRPLTEVERVQMIRLGQQKKHQQLLAHQQGGKPFVKGMILVDKEAQAKANYDQMIRNDVHYQQHKQHKQQLQQQQSLVEIEKMGRAKMQKQAIIWDRSSQQELHPYAEPHAPQSSIPGLPNMFMQMPAYNGAVRLAHTSAVGQGLVGACTFAMCRRSFLTWMAGTPMAQLSEQGTDLEQINGIERRLLRYTDDAAYCLDLLSILGFSWSSGEREVPTSKSAWH